MQTQTLPELRTAKSLKIILTKHGYEATIKGDTPDEVVRRAIDLHKQVVDLRARQAAPQSNELDRAALPALILNSPEGGYTLLRGGGSAAPWNPAVAGLVGALVLVRIGAKLAGVELANWGSGTNWRQAFWTGCAMAPMSAVALLLVTQFLASSPTLGPRIASIALPAILLMEVLGAVIATLALYRAGESSAPAHVEPSRARGPGAARG